jgi:uncharacterized glyoxalase superfamily protein PhnB
MKIQRSALSLNVDDPEVSAAFLARHFGFNQEMAADGFVSMARADAGFNVIYLRTGLATLKPEHLKHQKAEGVLVVFEVDDIDAEFARLQAEGATIVTPLETEEWGERFFQVVDPSGVIIQLVEWVGSPTG